MRMLEKIINEITEENSRIHLHIIVVNGLKWVELHYKRGRILKNTKNQHFQIFYLCTKRIMSKERKSTQYDLTVSYLFRSRVA